MSEGAMECLGDSRYGGEREGDGLQNRFFVGWCFEEDVRRKTWIEL